MTDGSAFNGFRTCSRCKISKGIYKNVKVWVEIGCKLLVIEGLSLMLRKVNTSVGRDKLNLMPKTLLQCPSCNDRLVTSVLGDFIVLYCML